MRGTCNSNKKCCFLCINSFIIITKINSYLYFTKKKIKLKCHIGIRLINAHSVSSYVHVFSFSPFLNHCVDAPTRLPIAVIYLLSVHVLVCVYLCCALQIRSLLTSQHSTVCGTQHGVHDTQQVTSRASSMSDALAHPQCKWIYNCDRVVFCAPACDGGIHVYTVLRAKRRALRIFRIVRRQVHNATCCYD